MVGLFATAALCSMPATASAQKPDPATGAPAAGQLELHIEYDRDYFKHTVSFARIAEPPEQRYSTVREETVTYPARLDGLCTAPCSRTLGASELVNETFVIVFDPYKVEDGQILALPLTQYLFVEDLAGMSGEATATLYARDRGKTRWGATLAWLGTGLGVAAGFLLWKSGPTSGRTQDERNYLASGVSSAIGGAAALGGGIALVVLGRNRVVVRPGPP